MRFTNALFKTLNVVLDEKKTLSKFAEDLKQGVSKQAEMFVAFAGGKSLSKGMREVMEETSLLSDYLPCSS